MSDVSINSHNFDELDKQISESLNSKKTLPGSKNTKIKSPSLKYKSKISIKEMNNTER